MEFTLSGEQRENNKEIQINKALAFQVALWLSTCLPMQEMQVRSLGREDLLQKDIATYSSILAWEILCTEEPGGLQSVKSQRIRHD